MGWIDIVVIAILIIAAIIGLAKGFFESLLSLFGTGLALVAAYFAGVPVANFLNGIVDINGFIAGLLTDWGVAADGKVNILFQTFTVDKAANFVTIVLSIVVVFILIKLAILLLSKLFDSATKNNSALSGLNRLLGLVFGAVKGAVFVGILLVATSLVSTVAFSQQINDEISKNQMTNFVYNYVDTWVQDTLKDQLRKWIGDPETEETGTEETGTEETGTEETPVTAKQASYSLVVPTYLEHYLV